MGAFLACFAEGLLEDLGQSGNIHFDSKTNLTEAECIVLQTTDGLWNLFLEICGWIGAALHLVLYTDPSRSSVCEAMAMSKNVVRSIENHRKFNDI